MSRNFFGGGGFSGGLGKGRNPFAAKTSSGSAMFSRKRKKSMQEMVEDKASHKVKSHKEMVEDSIHDKMFNPSKNKMSFNLPGTEGGEQKQYSKGYLQALEMAKNKALKKQAGRNDRKVKVTPKAFGGPHGGRIDANGKIVNGKGQVLFTINLDTGVIKDSMGMKVGKYKPFSFGNDNKIEKLIEKYSNKPGYGSGTGMNLFSGDKS